jgi:hypothetical protein
MTLDEFTAFLDHHGIDYKPSGVSLVLKSCPACGSEDWKVRLRVIGVEDDEPFLGRCQHGQCEEGYSSFKYLLMMGIPGSEIRALHGNDDKINYESLNPDLFKSAVTTTSKSSDVSETETSVDLSKFMPISAWPDHPAAKYAIKRGAVPEFYDRILIDPDKNAVVFVCYDDNRAVGYQKRFVTVTDPNLKAMSSLGFQKSQNLMAFPRNNAEIIVCEGPFTALSAYHFGYYGVCTFGANISELQVDKIIDISNRQGMDIGVAGENDVASKNCFDKLRKAMYWFNKGVFCLSAMEGDLNDAWQRGGTIVKTYDQDWGGPAMPDLSGML